MVNTIGQVLNWRGMEPDVRKLTGNCLACLNAKHPTTRYGKLPPMAVEVWPWFVVDSIGPYGRKGFRALTWVIDTATWMIEILPPTDATSMEEAYLVYRYWFACYSRSTRGIHDGGSDHSVIERVHRVIGEKTRTKSINTQRDWANFLNDTMFAMRASNHSMLKASPTQLAFGRDTQVYLAHETDWQAEHQRKVNQVRAHNAHQVLLRRDACVQSKMQPLFDGPFEVIAAQEHGTFTLDKVRYLEKANVRRVRPCKAKRGGYCEQPQ
ncbi:uncharacterized protein PITG_06333 [Phytophthora infestans T30-4]|uniref:Integrase catalytic domain-containing protein n=1 Tax=Phytophthora infestans (strain T30-4) TaxID=403677 RepID=D0N4L8_PHYIT|nr:uncharacterized protein PITG_06333 [Phytophthora infestans T30-4]EEY69826.1 hypothetical protein PITG_06333 [Phytophthora infestans T30-4]|eukprot:XP_002998473.1 hypothetical protein PITG_06333 [Phytophthora infestans T30-4]